MYLELTKASSTLMQQYLRMFLEIGQIKIKVSTGIFYLNKKEHCTSHSFDFSHILPNHKIFLLYFLNKSTSLITMENLLAYIKLLTVPLLYGRL